MAKLLGPTALLRKAISKRRPSVTVPPDAGKDVAKELEQLQKWVRISSPSFDRAGVEKLQDLVRAELIELGFECTLLPHPEDRFAPFLCAEIGGETEGFISLICHTDTVLPASGFHLSDDQKHVQGSGVIDDKGGLVVLCSALRRFLSTAPRLKYGLRVLCSPNEEAGSSGYIPLYRRYAPDTLFALGLEPALANGSIVSQRRGNRWYDIEVTGREAHAGRSKGEHVNAAHDLAAKIVALQKLNAPKKEIAVNIGHFEGGQNRHNIICGHATAKLDVRFATLKDRDRLHAKIDKILRRPAISLDRKTKSQTRYEIVDDCPPVFPTSRALRLADVYIQLVEKLEGRKIEAEPAGGAGDVNYLSGKGVVVLDGFGPVGGEMHTKNEFVIAQTLSTRAAALGLFLEVIQRS